MIVTLHKFNGRAICQKDARTFAKKNYPKTKRIKEINVELFDNTKPVDMRVSSHILIFLH
jgi:hypothetical protein